MKITRPSPAPINPLPTHVTTHIRSDVTLIFGTVASSPRAYCSQKSWLFT